MRLESAETKVAAESRLTEARIMMEDAQKKIIEAEAKLHAAESLQAEANRCNRAAERKLQEVEAREDDLRRRMACFKSEYAYCSLLFNFIIVFYVFSHFHFKRNDLVLCMIYDMIYEL